MSDIFNNLKRYRKYRRVYKITKMALVGLRSVAAGGVGSIYYAVPIDNTQMKQKTS